MGKATRWLKGLLSKIRSDSPPSDPPKEKRRWSLLKSSSPNAALHRRGGGNPTPSTSSLRSHSPHPAPAKNAAANDARHHAIAVAAASAVAAEAAVAAAQAAADVVRLAASGRVYAAAPPPAHVSLCDGLDSWAAVVIQSHFRGYLARRALRALKGLVKLQALVRGHIMRRKAAETMRSIQAMLRAQERARSMRAYESPNSSEKSSQTYHRGPPTPEKFEQISYSKNTKNTQSAMPKGSRPRSINKVIIHPDQRYLNPSWSESQFDESTWAARWRHPQHRTTASSSGEEEYRIKPDKVLEVDIGMPPKQGPKRRKNLFESIGLVSSNPKEDLSAYQTTFKRSTQDEDEEVAFCTAENSPQCYSASSRGGLSSRRQSPRTPTKSDASATSCVSIYSDCPSYMAYTESSRAKMRSLSAPRQRQQQCQERVCPTKRWSVHQQRGVPSSGAMEACFASKAYAGSGHLERLGVPVRNNAPAYYSGCLD